MTQTELKKLIREELSTMLPKLTESRVDYDYLHEKVSTSSNIGKAWFNLIINLERVANEINDFDGSYDPSKVKTKLNMQMPKQKLEQVLTELNILQPLIAEMDRIQKLEYF